MEKNPFGDAKAENTKLWSPEVNPKKSYQLTNKRTRYEYSKIVQAITGCNHLAQYENKIATDFEPKIN